MGKQCHLERKQILADREPMNDTEIKTNTDQ